MTTRNKGNQRKTKVTKSDDADLFVVDDAATALGFSQALCNLDLEALTKSDPLSSIKKNEKSDNKSNLKNDCDYASDVEDYSFQPKSNTSRDNFVDGDGVGDGGDGAGKGDDDTGGGGDGAGKRDDDGDDESPYA